MNPRGILSLYLQGSPGTYKTTTLLTILGENRTILIRHKDKDKAKYYRPEIHKALIWDDVSFIHLPREYCINIVDSEREYQHDFKEIWFYSVMR